MWPEGPAVALHLPESLLCFLVLAAPLKIRMSKTVWVENTNFSSQTWWWKCWWPKPWLFSGAMIFTSYGSSMYNSISLKKSPASWNSALLTTGCHIQAGDSAALLKAFSTILSGWQLLNGVVWGRISDPMVLCPLPYLLCHQMSL